MFDFVGALNKLYRDDAFILAIFGAISTYYEKLCVLIAEVEAQFFFDTMTICLPWYEKWLKIIPKQTQSLDDRRATVEARSKSKGHNSVAKIQAVANSWMRGETQIDFIGGKLLVTFVGHYGVPDDLETLKEAIDDVKPAHLGVEYRFKYILVKDVHEVMTVNQLQSLTVDMFAGNASVEG